MLCACAESYLGRSVSEAVITVPGKTLSTSTLCLPRGLCAVGQCLIPWMSSLTCC